jgi:hypothetical protein
MVAALLFVVGGEREEVETHGAAYERWY